MRGKFAVAASVFALAIGLSACEGAAHGTCASAEGVALKITILTDDLAKAQSTGKINAMIAGEIGAKIMAAGAQFKTDGNHRAYCGALDQIRKDAGL
jgi:hypothetical protein